jgi:hypothetical protein
MELSDYVYLLRIIAAKLTHYLFDIVGHTELRYKAISPFAWRTWYGRNASKVTLCL